MKDKILVKLFESMKHSKGFPALETTVASVMSHLRDKSKGPAALVEPIVSDFAMTQRVLNLVNSAMYAPFAKDISSVSKALQIIGNDALSHIVISVSLMPVQNTGDDEFGELSKTLLASELARSASPNDCLESMATAALVYNLGTLVVDKFLPEELSRIKQMHANGTDLETAAKNIIGMTLTDVGVEVAKKWKFPQDLVAIIDGTGDKNLVQVAMFANAGATLIYENREEELAPLLNALNVPGLDKSKLELKLLEKVGERLACTHQTVIKTASSERILTDMLCDLLDDKPSNLATLAQKVFVSISAALKTTHCLLFAPVRNGEYRIMSSYGKGTDEIKSRFKITVDASLTAFHAVIRKNVDISITDVSRLKANALPDLYKELMPDIQSFIILPITKGGVAGMLYLDWDTRTELETTELGLLRKIRDLFLPYFQSVAKLSES